MHRLQNRLLEMRKPCDYADDFHLHIICKFSNEDLRSCFRSYQQTYDNIHNHPGIVFYTDNTCMMT